jgi:hypothetical protein
MMLQLSPPLWVATPMGEGFALLVIDYGPQLNSVWVVQHFKDGQILHVDSAEVRVMGNEMYDIPDPEVPVKRCI